MRLFTLTLCALIACFSTFAQKSYDIVSPDGTLKADVTIADGKITYNVIKTSGVDTGFLKAGAIWYDLDPSGLKSHYYNATAMSIGPEKIK